MRDRWTEGSPPPPPPPPDADDLDHIVYLSNLVGLEETLVQPGGGNSSIKVGRPDDPAGHHLLVKGSGTDLGTIGRAGFTRLSLDRLAELREHTEMADDEMMRFLARAMVETGQPMPSVETPLHSMLPQRVIVHTHDVTTMSITNIPGDRGAALVRELFDGAIHYLPYVRPGFPLAALVAREGGGIPEEAQGLVLAHHGLVVWADDVAECYRRIVRVVTRMEDYIARAHSGHGTGGDGDGDRSCGTADSGGQARAPGTARAAPEITPERRRELGTLVLPVVRGALGGEERVILHLDQSPDVLEVLGRERFGELSQRGMATPEHILRAGRLPLWLALDFSRPAEELTAAVRAGIAAGREAYLAYHQRNARGGEDPLTDWVKVLLIPGLGLVTAFRDKKSALTANACYRAVMASIENAEAIDTFSFISEAAVFEFEHWPLERRKVEETIRRERETLLVPRHVVVVIGAGSGIGRAAALGFAREGASVVVADRNAAAAGEVAAAIDDLQPARALAVATDVTDDAAIAELFDRAVLEFGGVDCLFYAAGVPPRFAPITGIERADLMSQLEVHFLGAVLAIKAAGRVMERQGTGGSIIASVSKAAVAAGRDAVAYGASKAALLQALRVAAVELGPAQIRVNAINADQVETPLFMKFVAERAAGKGISVEDQLESYRQRNVMGASLIPAEAVADLAVLLASDRFRYTTGDVLTIDGGLPEAFPR